MPGVKHIKSIPTEKDIWIGWWNVKKREKYREKTAV